MTGGATTKHEDRELRRQLAVEQDRQRAALDRVEAALDRVEAALRRRTEGGQR